MKELFKIKELDINAKDSNGNTVLMANCDVRKIDVVNLLIQNGTKLDVTNNDGKSPMDLILNDIAKQRGTKQQTEKFEELRHSITTKNFNSEENYQKFVETIKEQDNPKPQVSQIKKPSDEMTNQQNPN